MKTFREHLNEEITIGALASGGIDIERDAVRDEVNGILAGIAARPCVTPYASLNKVRKALAYFHIHLPKKVYLEGRHGIEVWEVNQFGNKMGFTDTGEWINQVPAKYYLFFHYHLVGSMYYLQAKIVDDKELESKIGAAESMVAEETLEEAIRHSTSHKVVHADSKKIVAQGSKKEMMKKMKELNSKNPRSHFLGNSPSKKVGDVFGEETDAAVRQAVAKAAAPKEKAHTVLDDCDCSQGDSPSTQSAIKVMMKKQVEEGIVTGPRSYKGSPDRKRKAVQMALGRKHKDHPDWNPRTNPQYSALKLGRKLQKQGVTEEEQIDEVSLGKLVRYKRGAEKSHGDATWETKFTKSMGDDPSPSKALARKREKGIALADKKMKGKAKVNASMPKNAYMEETQIDEISKELANKYRKKAHASYTYAAGKREDDRFHERGGKDMTDVFGKPKFKDRPESEKAKDEKTIGKRLKGLTMAHKRLKEEKIDEVSAGLASRAAHHAYVKSDKMKKDAQKEPDMYSYVQAFHKGEKKNKQGIKFAKYAANKMEEDKDPCWKGYEMVGMKKKGGRQVPNCVPVKEEQIDEVSKKTLRSYLAKKKDRNKDYATPESFRKGMLSPNLAKDKIKGKNVKVHAKEETQIDELKQATLKAYKSAAKADRNVSKEVVRKGLDTEGKFKHAIKKRKKGLERVSDRLEEKAPPGAKFERMVKHIKKGYSKDGLTAKEKSIAYATAWKAKKREENK